MLLGNFAHHSLCDLSAFPEAGEMYLTNLLAAAHVVHQIELVPFLADKRHDFCLVHPISRVVYLPSTTRSNEYYESSLEMFRIRYDQNLSFEFTFEDSNDSFEFSFGFIRRTHARSEYLNIRKLRFFPTLQTT